MRGIERGGRLALRPAVAAATDTSVRCQHGAAFAVEYTNTPAGLRQNYYLSSARPGPPAPCRCSWGATALALEVNDAGTTYPLTIDPLAITPLNRLNEHTNADNDCFGLSVTGAGDVNGVGYADVLVGTPYMGNGQAYLSLGSATALGTATDTTAGTVQRLNDPNKPAVTTSARVWRGWATWTATATPTCWWAPAKRATGAAKCLLLPGQTGRRPPRQPPAPLRR